jgi:hypothetical protein
VNFHGWEDRGQLFSSKARLQEYLSTTLSAVYQEDVSIFLRDMRNPLSTLRYATKGYAHSDHLPMMCKAPLTVKAYPSITNHRFAKTKGEGARSKLMELFRLQKMRLAVEHLSAFFEYRDDQDLRAYVQALYDLDLAVLRHNKRSTQTKRQTSRSDGKKRAPAPLNEGKPSSINDVLHSTTIRDIATICEAVERIQPEAVPKVRSRLIRQAHRREATRLNRLTKQATHKPNKPRFDSSWLKHAKERRQTKLDWRLALLKPLEPDSLDCYG